MLLLELLTEAKARDRPLSISGAIYDSAPSKYFYWWAPYVVIAAGHYPPSQQALLTVKFMGATAVARMIARAKGNDSEYSTMPAGMTPFGGWTLGAFGDLRDASVNRPRPELFVFGSSDHMITVPEVEDFIAHRKRQGADVTTLALDSCHVQHFKKYPAEYASAVSAFLEKLPSSSPLSKQCVER